MRRVRLVGAQLPARRVALPLVPGPTRRAAVVAEAKKGFGPKRTESFSAPPAEDRPGEHGCGVRGGGVGGDRPAGGAPRKAVPELRLAAEEMSSTSALQRLSRAATWMKRRSQWALLGDAR